ncbi:DNA-directed DNA polymerase [Malassezia sp. CBS 17886]|nr:DNA-directed DNA polymerase [Malassezia sp. CBS 17886]
MRRAVPREETHPAGEPACAGGARGTPSLRVYIANVDYVLARPARGDRAASAFATHGAPLPRVPVLRVYGATPDGQRCCMHVHNVYPYLYVEYRDALVPSTVLPYIQRLGCGLNQALADSFHQPSRDVQMIAAIHLCKGTPFYGFHDTLHYYLKISYTDPNIRLRLADILSSGKLMGTHFQPYEAHLQYQLQWMIDYNLYGCDYMQVDQLCMRLPLPPPLPDDAGRDCASINAATVPATWLPHDAGLPRDSYCALEADVDASAIVNRRWVHASQAGPADARHASLGTVVPSLRVMWQEEAERRAALHLDERLEPPSAAPRHVSAGDVQWAASARDCALLDARIAHTGAPSPAAGASGGFARFILDAYDTVELFHPGGLDRLSHAHEAPGASARMFDLAFVQSQSSSSSAGEPGTATTPLPTSVSVSPPVSPPLSPPEAASTPVPSSSPALPGARTCDASAPSRAPHSTGGKRSIDSVAADAFPDGGAPRARQRTRGAPPHLRPQHAPSPARQTRAAEAPTRWFTLREPAPSVREVTGSMRYFNLPDVEYADPHYSDPQDMPAVAHAYGGKLATARCSAVAFMPPFQHWHDGGQTARAPGARVAGAVLWQYGPAPPSAANVTLWATAAQATRGMEVARKLQPRSQLDARSDAQSSSRTGTADALKTYEVRRPHMTLLALECLVLTHGSLSPNPATDEVAAVVYMFQQDAHCTADSPPHPPPSGGNSDTASLYEHHCGIILVSHEAHPRLALEGTDVLVVEDELALLNAVVDVTRSTDAEMLAGYDVQRTSWGYLVERARTHFEYDLAAELGRTRAPARAAAAAVGAWAERRTSALRVPGRHVINIWRLMQREVALAQYTLESTVHHILRERTPRYTYETLTAWMTSQTRFAVRALRYVLRRVRLSVRLLEKTEILFRTAEFASVYGIDFFSVLSRGSQFRVESVMLRITKPRSFLLPSPSRAQVGEQNAAECVPLILEPRSDVYKDPVLVLDFQSLYPSMMIAYNIWCVRGYSTCLGRVTAFKGAYRLGFTQQTVSAAQLAALRRDVLILPNGIMFVRPHIRESVLARMLREVLDTRQMVRRSTRDLPQNRAFQRLQHARQLSLKLLANVTYGYTSASHSGRMPCVEIADAIVQSARETLERTMALVERTPAWGARVVYGDTDSLFVQLRGASREDAFRIGHEVAEAATLLNPEPVRLQFEKMYLPSVLVAKKRYAGYKYEAAAQRRPVLDVKGLEIVRRDGHVALQRMQESCLRILFETQDLSEVKQYCQRQWRRIMAGHISPHHLLMAKEVRLGSYSAHAQPPPGAVLAMRELRHDPHGAPHRNERVPYLMRQSAPGAKLSDMVFAPAEVLADPLIPLHTHYYIQRTIIPPLARILQLAGADVQAWFDEMPKARRIRSAHTAVAARDASRLATLRAHYHTDGCEVCGQRTAILVSRTRTQPPALCLDCMQNPETSTYDAVVPLHAEEARQRAIHAICTSCAGEGPLERPPCVSLDCPLRYSRARNDALAGARGQGSPRNLRHIY